MATRLCVIMHSIETLAMFLHVSREFHSRGSSIDVTESTCCVTGCSALNLLYFAFLFLSVWRDG
jgi:hypothetical protein